MQQLTPPHPDASAISLEHSLTTITANLDHTHLPESLTQFDQLPASAHVQVHTVAKLMGVSRATVWRMVKRGQLPTPKKLSDRATRWNVGELREALAQ